MGAHLLRTKLIPSSVRSKLVPRPGLIERLDHALSKKISLISAPAGYGKTTLIQSWIQDRTIKTAWFSIDERDNELIRFWSYCVAAMQVVNPEISGSILAALRSTADLHIEDLLVELINEISPGQEILLVLDDYHLITERKIHESLQFFLRNSPPQLHLIISTRSDPPWPLARTRAQQDLLEFRVEDLQFTHDESEFLFNQIMGFNLTPESVQKIKTRTEGWVAGLQMAALSMQNHNNLEHFIEHFSANNNHIYDFMVEEILANQSPEVKGFLLKTSVLNRMSASLCDRVLEISNSAEILEYLNQTNIFISPLDQQRQWYTYHRLFRDLLQLQLKRQRSDSIPDLHRRASQWFVDQNQLNEAVSYAMQVNDYPQFAAIAEKKSLEMVQQQELTTLKRWLEKLPDEELINQPWLAIGYAWVLVNTCNLFKLEKWLNQIEVRIQTYQGQETDRLLANIYAIRHYMHGQRWDHSSALKFGELALKLFPEKDSARTWTSVTIAHCWRKIGDLKSAEQYFNNAIQFCENTTNVEALLHAELGLANIHLVKGKLYQAEQSLRRILLLAGENNNQDNRYPITGYVQSAIGAILLQWNQLDSALEFTRKGMTLSERWGQLDFLSFSYVQHKNVLMALGQKIEAQSMIQKIDRLIPLIPASPGKLMSAFKLNYLLMSGDVEAASKIAESCQFSAEDPVEFLHVPMYIIFARLLVKKGDFSAAIHLLEKLRAICDSAGAVDFLVHILILQSIAYQKNNQADSAHTALLRAVQVGEPGGYLRAFLVEDPVFGEILTQVTARAEDNHYAKNLLSFWRLEYSPRNGYTCFNFIEPLTPREFEVLRFLTTSQSVPEIADQMVVSANTVRTHVQHIYDKLGVNRRRSAVQKAKLLDLV